MFESNLIDLDELVLMVRARDCRAYIGEAIATYRARAYRSALLATWIAVACDIIGKIRDLQLQGDAAAGAFVTNLDNAIEASERGDPGGIKRLQIIENELLDKALKDFEFLSAQEHKDLDRLKSDRHLCAHPAFAKDASLFQPSAELVRAHITHAVCHLLRHPPVQGSHALKRLKEDLLRPSFPATQKAVSDFLGSRYLNYAKASLIESLVSVFLKILIKQSERDLIGKEDIVLMSLVAVGVSHQAIYERQMSDQLPHLTDGSNDTELKRVFRLFRADKRCWGWLSEANRLRISQIATDYRYDPADMDCVVQGLEIDELKPLVLESIARFAKAEKEKVFSSHHRLEFVPEAIELLATSRSYRGAELVEQAILLPLCGILHAEHVQRILLAAEENGQIHDAGGTPAFMLEVFDRTADLRTQTREAWQRFMTRMLVGKEPDEWNAYPELRLKLEAAGMWPPP